MAHQTILEAMGRLGGVILLFGFLWAGLSLPKTHQRRGRVVKTGPVLVIALGLALMAVGFGIIEV